MILGQADQLRKYHRRPCRSRCKISIFDRPVQFIVGSFLLYFLQYGKKSSATGKENVTKLTTLERQIPSLIEETIEMEQAKQEQAAQSVDPESTGSAATVQDPAEVYEAYRQDYNADLATNKTYQKDIKETNENAKLNLGYAATGTAAGTARTALGASEIAMGTILAAQWWNPAAMMLGIFGFLVIAQ